MHILFINSWYPNRVLKQNGDFIMRHAEAVALKHQVTAIHVKSDKNTKGTIEITDNNIKNVRTLIAYTKTTKNPLLKIIRFLKAYFLLVKKAGVFDIMHVNKIFPAGIIAYYIKKQKSIPYIISEHHSIYKKEFRKRIGFVQKTLTKLIAKNASYIVPVTDNLAMNMKEFGIKGNYKKVPNVVNTKKFIPKNKKNEIFTILHISSMVALKNIDGILRVIKKIETKIPDFHFQMIGGNASRFIKKAKELNIKESLYTFKNQVSHQEIIRYFQDANVFVLFSSSENLPCVILEAFSCGTPVIATNVGGIAEYFPKDFGILIDKQDEVALENAILKIYTDFKKATPDKMHRYVEKHFSEIEICNRFTSLYTDALKNKTHQ